MGASYASEMPPIAAAASRNLRDTLSRSSSGPRAPCPLRAWPEPDAGVILEELAVLGIARLLDSEDASTRVELTIIPKSEIVAEDRGSRHASAG